MPDLIRWGDMIIDSTTGKCHIDAYITPSAPISMIEIVVNFKSKIHKRKIRTFKNKTGRGKINFAYQSMFNDPLKVVRTIKSKNN